MYINQLGNTKNQERHGPQMNQGKHIHNLTTNVGGEREIEKKLTIQHEHKLKYTINNGLSSVINLHEFRPFTMRFHARS